MGVSSQWGRNEGYDALPEGFGIAAKLHRERFSPSERATVEAPLAECEACRLEFEAMARLVEKLESLPPVGVPRSFKDAVMRALPPKKPVLGGK